MLASEALVDVADDLFATIERGDEPRLDELLADDVAVWRAGAQHDDDKVRAMKVLRWFIRVTTERSYQVLDRRLFPGGFVQQHILHATGTNGGLIALRVCIVITVNSDNQINRIDEYFDPADLAPIMN
jgi:ketosteroid isomerase-like protein